MAPGSTCSSTTTVYSKHPYISPHFYPWIRDTTGRPASSTNMFQTPSTSSTPRQQQSGRPSIFTEEEGVITVGCRPSLPTLYMTDETGGPSSVGGSGHLRYRNRSNDDSAIVTNLSSSSSSSEAGGSSVPLSASVRASPCYGTPGSAASSSSCYMPSKFAFVSCSFFSGFCF